jgi:hypothetical protein
LRRVKGDGRLYPFGDWLAALAPWQLPVLTLTCAIPQRFSVNEASAAPDENGVNSPVCQRIFSACNRGDAKSCAVYEEQCQND